MNGTITARVLAASALLIVSCSMALAQDLKTYTIKGSFEDVRFELSNEIVNKGLVVDFNGFVGKMLARTGSEVGATENIYKSAEYFSFCSAKLSRAMVEADPAHIGYCPYVIFIYELKSKPGEIVVGYRPPPAGQKPASKTALKAIDDLLDGIVKAATN